MNVVKQTTVFIVAAFVSLAYAGTGAELDLSRLPPAAQTKGLTYDKDIRPVLEQSCTRCHGSERPKAGLRLDNLEGVLKGGKEGKVIIPGQSEKSPLIHAIARLDPEKAMPPSPRPGQFGRQGGAGGGGPPPGSGAPNSQRPPGGPAGHGGFGPPPKPLTAEQIGLFRAWVDQGAN